MNPKLIMRNRVHFAVVLNKLIIKIRVLLKYFIVVNSTWKLYGLCFRTHNSCVFQNQSATFLYAQCKNSYLCDKISSLCQMLCQKTR